jgi:hypothetical protein
MEEKTDKIKQDVDSIKTASTVTLWIIITVLVVSLLYIFNDK